MYELKGSFLHRIESEGNEEFLMQELLLRRYSLVLKGEEVDQANAIERAVDLHALRVIGSSGYQKCINYLWRGWLIQDEFNPSCYKEYTAKADPSYWAHFNPDRMRTPQFQNAVQISVSIIYLVLYTIAINTINKNGDLDIVEGILYVFTAGFIFDELTKLWKDKCPLTSQPCTLLTALHWADTISASGMSSTAYFMVSCWSASS